MSNGLQVDMPGWSEYLFQLKNENHLMHLAIKSMTNAHWATTPGFKMTQKETSCLSSIINNSNHRLKQFQLAGKTYITDVYTGEVSEQHLHGIRKNRRDGKECAWIAKTNGYLVVGVAEESEDKACIDTVWKIFRYLQNQYEHVLF